MSNVDLIQAIENVRHYRSKVEYFENRSLSVVNHFADQLCLAEAHLASLMINLQDGYDLALLPKAQVKSCRE